MNKYINDWEKFNETLLLEKEDFYSHLNMEDITDANYTHTNGVCKDLKVNIMICTYKAIHFLSWRTWKFLQYVS